VQAKLFICKDFSACDCVVLAFCKAASEPEQLVYDLIQRLMSISSWFMVPMQMDALMCCWLMLFGC